MNKPAPDTHLDTGTLTALVVGDLNARAKQKAQAHLLVCPHCTRECEEIEQLWTTAKIPATTGNAEAVRQMLLPQVAAHLKRETASYTFFTVPRMSVGVVGALGIAAVLWLSPGAPLHPLPAFADVERAMRQINTATWTEATYKGGTEDSPLGETDRYEMQRRPEPVIIRRAILEEGKEQRKFVQVTNRWGCFTPHNSGYIIWKRGNRVESQVQEMLYFPSLPRLQDQWEADRDSRERWGWKWTRSPWKREMATRNKHSLFRFTAQDEQWRSADRNHSALRVTIDKTVWVDPKTFHIVRSENRYTDRDGQWLTVRENFQYDQPSAGPLDAQLPPLGKTVAIFDTSLSVPGAPRVSDSEIMEVKRFLNRVGTRWSNPGVANSDLLDTEEQGRMLASIPNPSKRGRQIVEMSEKPGQKSILKRFTVIQIAEVRYNPSTYRRDKLNQAFPPALKDTPYRVIASVSGTSTAGKPVVCPALFSLRRANGTLRFTAAAFFPAKPAAAARGWTQKALHKMKSQ